jgi:flagellar protein FliL
MATTAADEEREAEQQDAAAPAAKQTGLARRKLALIVGGALLLIVGAGAAAYVFGLLDMVVGAKDTADAERSHKIAEAPPVFYALPELLVSLNTGERRSTSLKVKISVQLADAGDQPRVERQLPRIVDYCQVYLRELRLDELRGSAGTARLREELLRRISAAVAPVSVVDVLFGEIFVQ